jgi:hypothetical protein
MPKGTTSNKTAAANKKTVKPTTKPVMKTVQKEEAKATKPQAKGPEAPKEDKKPEPNTMLYSNEVAQALLDHFMKTPHVMAEVEGLVNALRNGIPVVYNQDEQA